MVENEDCSGTAAFLVVLNEGDVLAKQAVTVGEN
jgi:hypothetical protein